MDDGTGTSLVTNRGRWLLVQHLDGQLSGLPKANSAGASAYWHSRARRIHRPGRKAPACCCGRSPTRGRPRSAPRPLDLTHVQFVLLASLAWQQDGRPVTQRQLAEHARADPMMTSPVVRTLEAKGLLRRRPHPTDARPRALRATPASIELANQAHAAVEQVDRDYFGVLGDDRPAFTRMLARLTDQT